MSLKYYSLPKEIKTLVFDIDNTLYNHRAYSDIFLHAAEKAQSPPSQMVSIGDRYDVDIAPALAVGMGGILCEEISGIYGLDLIGS